MKLKSRVLLIISVAVCAAAIALLSLAILSSSGVPAESFDQRLHAIEQQTHSVVTQRRSSVRSDARAPILCRMRAALVSLVHPRQPSILGSKNYETEYSIRAGDVAISVDVIVLEDRVCVASVVQPNGSGELARQWVTALRETFPKMPVFYAKPALTATIPTNRSELKKGSQ